MTKSWHRPSLWVAVAMAVLTLIPLAGLVFDDRVLNGEPLWLKPFKFGLSLTIYAATLSWMLSLPHKGKRWTSGLATFITVILFADVALVGIQAARGTFSHFNSVKGDPVNQVVQFMFGTSIPLMFLANIVLAIFLSVQKLGDRPTTWAIRSGLYLAILGMASGYLMVFQGKSKRSVVTDATGHDIKLHGGHAVGVPDGGPGMPVTTWSTTGGDLRIPHFFGMHGLQVLILLGLGLAALGLAERTRLRLVVVAALGYAGVFGALTWQALRGEPLVHPGPTTLASLLAVLAAVVLGVAWAFRKTGTAAPAPVRQPVPQR
ncbi:hypothetical protein [Saccharothrix variisporea]|uniref:Uncharacterized protein n=1 Tax=Saccharothrix variisporea TaxID=543527 RepID=A0A495XL02_9PSEU|nr:hypothetical protein [Saccharothrix variisporea]RKT73103.1 hypothetical protein DFJ66_6430 [Saccharothrix variisporea]